jgi:hypothetical protein
VSPLGPQRFKGEYKMSDPTPPKATKPNYTKLQTCAAEADQATFTNHHGAFAEVRGGNQLLAAGTNEWDGQVHRQLDGNLVEQLTIRETAYKPDFWHGSVENGSATLVVPNATDAASLNGAVLTNDGKPQAQNMQKDTVAMMRKIQSCMVKP